MSDDFASMAWSELLTSALPADAKLASSTTVAASNLAVGSLRMSAAAVAASKLRATARRLTHGTGGAKPCTERTPTRSLRLLRMLLSASV
jgi:hypothetical protein